MHRIDLSYTLRRERVDAAVHHPLFALLDALHRSGSISAAAKLQELSYRHVWGELKRWEGELGRELVIWAKGQPATLTPFGEKLLWAERRAQARLAPQIEALRSELESAFADAFDDRIDVLSVCASHDQALPLLRDLARREQLHLDLGFAGSLDALAALNEGRCQLAGFHVREGAARGSASARAYRPRLKPGLHKLIGFAQRTQGLMTAPGNPLAIDGLRDFVRPALRRAGRAPGTGTRVLLDELLAQAGLETPADTLTEPSHGAAAQAVASGAADVAFGLQAAAQAAGLHFVPIAQERYYLVTLKSLLVEPALQRLIALLGSSAWAAELATLPGYAPSQPGTVLSLTKVLPWWQYAPKG
ncbi:substrate-binding domain-containing protein [Rivibacter subsaxonicus]|uniref:LysR family transcriptional regulator of molybdate metabolism n=1 Tax=Rivibacter subsaxonicus TaxID=457575 RepID=A0A4Q7W0H9_9BURK|nr:substrate-binding domain-containing protein [Rivibacter subsaxonicus]RZU02677.1 LysR family transcriptional regulator of molybdate metabolism [Rivibacter subsaxonicus]